MTKRSTTEEAAIRIAEVVNVRITPAETSPDGAPIKIYSEEDLEDL